MKILSVTVPCYNSAEYMSNAIESLLPGGEDIEIIVVDDGSSDDTAKIADEYAAKYPTIIKAIHQPNGGHGAAVNTGMENATGMYFKVVDSDDKVGEDALMKVLDTLKYFTTEDTPIDMLISNFVYDKVGVAEDKKKVMSFEGIMPQNFVFDWEITSHFKPGDYMLMHSVIFRTQILRDMDLKLPRHTFYVDNIFVFEPLLHVERMYYLNVNFYYYFIGRDDQSVNESVMVKRVDQQLSVNYRMLDFYMTNKNEIKKNKRRAQYLYNYLEIITTVSMVLLLLDGSRDAIDKRTALLEYISGRDKMLYTKFRFGICGTIMTLPGKSGRLMSLSAYKLAQKFYNFN